ncbi:DNA cytosine methyltransferase [Amphibiibacter pelophylacis]|uniref:DNA (Cytosine-5-)-methyltransferase n=1 Tax=Amphibiibacter pelophylacis TaxID=1799477 RepID=A0ACC6NYM8_9BURK
MRARQRKVDLLKMARLSSSPLNLQDRLDVRDLMPQCEPSGLRCLSLFTGGGGLDLGFERAGFEHAACFELLDICGETLNANRPGWDIHAGDQAGDVQQADFSVYRGVDVVHGGPPCQPFSVAGKQAGADDPRNMWGDFIRCIHEAKPRAFVAENVVGLLDRKFDSFVQRVILDPLEKDYTVFRFRLAAHDFGVPQARRRVFFVGISHAEDASRFVQPEPTHGDVSTLFGPLLPRNTARRSLGLPDTGFDVVAPTLRSGFTGPRKTTGILNSKASLKIWNDLGIWPNGVQHDHALAMAYPPENGHFRLSTADCALLQGFPPDWIFSGAVYQVLGQIGNSVCPPVAYAVARAVADTLGESHSSPQLEHGAHFPLAANAVRDRLLQP